MIDWCIVGREEISYRDVVRETIRNVQLGDGQLQLLPVARMLYSYGGQVLGGHSGDCGQVIPSRGEQGVVAGGLEGGQPDGEKGVSLGIGKILDEAFMDHS